MMNPSPASVRGLTRPVTAADEVVQIAQRLIQIDTSNYGDDTGPGERAAAEYAAGLLAEVGLTVETIEPFPGRVSILTRVAGADPSRPALVLHGHTDVVPAESADWTHPPFSGEIVDGMLWGRGAVDMKGMDAIILSVIRQFVREGRKPARDVIVAMFADEEAGGVKGSQWIADHRPELFAGATEAISEVGGFSVYVADQRVYLLQTAEKGLAWLRLIAEGTAGHGSAVNKDNAVANLAAALTRISDYDWPIELNSATFALLKGISQLIGLPFDVDAPTAANVNSPEIRRQIQQLTAALGKAEKFAAATTRNMVNPTGLSAGYKANVIPSQATATLDVRPLPGRAEQVKDKILELAGPGLHLEPIHEDIGLEAPIETPLVAAMVAALKAADPSAIVLPYCLGAGTDNKALARVGISGYGFAPLRLPADLDFTGLFHGVDERVPIDSLKFGCDVLTKLLETC